MIAARARLRVSRRSPRGDAIRWAVHLGANTAKRLAAEWGVHVSTAWHLLNRADAAGLIVRTGTIPAKHAPQVVFSTPDPQEFP